jgi:TP901 family phage tail tape measure protein
MNRIQYRIDFDVNQSSLTGLKKTFSEILNLKEKGLMKINPEIDYRTAQRQFGQIRNEIVDLERAYDRAFDSDLGVLNLQKFNQELNGLDLNKVQERLSKAGTLGQRAFTQLAQSALTTNVQLKQTTNWLDSIGKTLGSTIKWGISSRIMNEFVGTVQGAYGYVKELDKSLNDIRIVTGKSADEMRKFAKEANTAAQSLGETTNSYTQASLIYYQQGLSDEETKARAETTLKAANVTGQSGEEVSEQLTAVWNGYKVAAEETELYVDKLAAVAATTASDLEELSTGMSKVASAASTTGVSIDELSAQMSTIISVTRQAPESVGTALKTIYARMTSLELGETDEDGMNLAKVTQSMSDMGIEVLDETGNLRDLGTVIEEVGAKWNTWTEAQRAAMAQTLAGTRQYNNLYALFENWDMYLSALETSQGAAGTLQKQQDTYMESTEAHLDRMAAAAENFQDSLLDDRGINAFADIMTVVTNLATGFVDSIGGGVGAVLNLGAVFTNVFKKQIATSLTPMVQNINAAKFNKEQLAAVEKHLEVFKSLELKTKSGAKALTDYQSKMSKYWSLMSTEEKRASMEQAKEIARLTDLKAAWEEANQEVNEYASAVAKAAGKTQDSVGKTQGLEIRANQYNELGDLGQTIRGLSVDHTKNQYEKVFEKNKDGSMTSKAKKQTAKAMSQAKDLQDYIKVYEQYGQKLKQLQKIQTSGGKLTQAETELMKKLQIAYNNVGKKLGDLPKLLKDVDLESGKLPDNFEDIVTALQALNKNGNGLKELLRNLFTEDDEQQIEAIANAVNGYAKEMKNLANVSGELEQENLDKLEKERELKTRANVEAVTEMTSALMSMGSIINNISTLPNIIQDEDLSDGEKFVQVLTNIGSTALSSIPQIINLTNMIKTSGNAGATAGAQTAAGMAGATAGMQTATGAAITLNSALGVIGLAAMALGAVFGVIGAVNTAIDNNNKALQEKNKATIEETKATTEQVKANNELYESYKLNEQQYKSGEISKQELLNTTEDLINAYDIENGHLMRLTGNYEGLSLAIEKARKAEAKQALDAAKKGTTAARQNVEIALRDHDVDLLDSDSSYSLFLGKNLSQEMQDVLNKNLNIDTAINNSDMILSGMAGMYYGGIPGLITGLAVGSTSTNYMTTIDTSSAAGLVEFYDNLVKTSQELDELGDQADETLKFEINQRIKELSEAMPELKEMVESVGDALILNADAGQKLNLAENSKEASEYIANFRKEMEALNNELPKAQRLTQEQLNKQTQEYLDNIENAYIQRQNIIEKLKKDANEEVDSILDGLTNEQLSLLLTIGVNEKTTKETVYQMCNTLQEWLDTDPDVQLILKMRTEGITQEDVEKLSDPIKKYLLENASGFSKAVQNKLLDIGTDKILSTNIQSLYDIGRDRASEEKAQLDAAKEDLEERVKQDRNYQLLSIKQQDQKDLDFIKEFYENYGYKAYKKVYNKEAEEYEYLPTIAYKDVSDESLKQFKEIKDRLLDKYGRIGGFSFNSDGSGKFVNELTILSPEEKKELQDQTEIYENQGEAIQSAYEKIEEVDLDQVQSILRETFDIGLLEVIDDADTLIDKIELIGEGFLVAAENAQKLIDTYPELLKGATIYADGSIKLDQQVVESNLNGIKAEMTANWALQRQELENQIELAEIEENYAKIRWETLKDYVEGYINETTAENKLEEETAKYQNSLNDYILKHNLKNDEIAITRAKKDTETLIDYFNDIGAAANKAGKEIAAAKAGETKGDWSSYVANSLVNNKEVDYTRLVDNIPDYIPYGDRKAWAKAEYNRINQFKSDDEKDSEYLEQLKRQSEEETGKIINEYYQDYLKKKDNTEELRKKLFTGDLEVSKALKQLDAMVKGESELFDLLDDISDLYHDINVELGITESKLNKLIDLQEQLTGQELLNNLKEQNALLENQIDLTNSKTAIAQLEQAGIKSELENKGFLFDEETGAISNYGAAMDKNLAYVNSEIEKYQGREEYEDYLDQLQEEYDQMVEWVEQYDDLLTNEIPGLEAEAREIQKQIVENNIKAFDVEINMHLETKDVTSEWNDFIKDFTLDEDDFVGRLQQDAASGLGEITGNLIGESVQRAKEVQAEIIKMQSGEESEIFGTDMAKAQEKLKELQTEVINNATAFKEYCDSIEESYFNLLDNADDRLEEHYSKYEQIQKKLTNSVRMTELIFGENAYGKKAEFYEAQQQANVGELDARRREVEMWKQALAEATPGTEEYDKIYAHLTEAQNALEDKVVESLEFIKTKYENTINDIFANMDQKVFGMSLENQDLEWEMATKMDDSYLDTVNKGYELEKLSYNFEKSKAGLSENSLKRINALQAEQMKMLREKENLSQYDVDRANKLLDIEMKRIALEEAESSKTSMRLRRDSQGNYSYQFVADAEAVDQARQDLIEAEQDLYNFDKERYIEKLEDWRETRKAFVEAWINADDEGRKILEKQWEVYVAGLDSDITDSYTNVKDSASTSLGEAAAIMKGTLFPQMETAISKGTSMKGAISGAFNSVVDGCKVAVNTFNNDKAAIEESSGVFFNTIGDNASEAKGTVNDLNTATGKLIDVLNTEIDTGKGIYDAMAVLKSSFSDATTGAADVVTAITNMVEKWNGIELKDQEFVIKRTVHTEKTGDVNYQDPVPSGDNSRGSSETTADEQLRDALMESVTFYGYNERGQVVTESYKNLKERTIKSGSDTNHNKTIMGKQVDAFVTDNYGRAYWYNSDEIDINKLFAFDTGGYTGEWNDTRGRLAMLHQKELVLNAQDTPRMLEAINITREMQNFIEAMRSHSIKDLMFNELELSFAKAAQSLNQATEAIQQQVQIEANFPDVRDAKEIEEALNNLVNMASQYAYRSKR